MKSRLGALLLAAALFTPGCVSGDSGRSFDKSRDMVAGDLAHFRNRAESGGGRLVDHAIGLPFFFLPVVLASEEAHADEVREDEYHYHFEEHFALGLVLVYADELAKFDDRGTSVAWSTSRRLLLGLLTSSDRSRRLLRDGSYLESSSYRFLTGLYGVEREGPKAEYRLLWFFKFGDDLD